MLDYTNLASPDEQVRTDLETCIAARGLIKFEQEKVLELLAEAHDDVERQAIYWKHDVIEEHIERAARIAEFRRAKLESLKTPEDYAQELEACSASGVEGTLYWFYFYAWGYDPREDSPLHVVPFYPFSFQEEYIRWIEDMVFRRRQSMLGEKSRDMGGTVIACDWSWKQFLFRPGFSALFTSAKEDLVDSKKDPDTLFSKLRFQARRTPTWMLPEGFDIEKGLTFMHLFNPANGSTLDGEAPTANVGHQRRRTFVLWDEAARAPYGGYPQYTGLSQVTRSLLMLSTPFGKNNKFADLKFDGKTRVFVMDWREHPFKDQRWYDALPSGHVGPAMSPAEIAEQIDRDYEASQPGRIFRFLEPWHVITWSDFERVYGVRHIPQRWLLARAQDVGTSDGHENITGWCARPTKADKYNDSIFFYRYFEAPHEWSIGQIAEGKYDTKTGALLAPGIWQREAPLKEKERMRVSLISWEAKSERRTYLEDCTKYKIDFECIKNPGPNEGLSEMVNLMMLLSEHHPFVNDPRTGEPLPGRPRLYLIVDDDQGQLNVNDEGILQRSPADEKNEGGQWLPRFELPLYHYPPNEKGKPVKLRRPHKANDNWIDGARYICRVWGAPSAEKTKAQQVEDKLPEPLKGVNLPPVEWREANPEDWAQLAAARAREQRAIEKELESREGGHWKEKGKQRSPRWSKPPAAPRRRR